MLEQPPDDAQQLCSTETAQPASTPPYKGGDGKPTRPRKTRPPGHQSTQQRLSRMAASGLVIGSMAKGTAWITRSLKLLRDKWEAEIVARTGQPPTDQDCRILHTAIHWQQHAMNCQRALRHLTLSPELNLSYSREIPRAYAERDRCLLMLQIKPAAGGASMPSITMAPAHPDDDDDE